MEGFTKLKKRGQRSGIRSGWNKHVEPYTRRKANKFVRRHLKKEIIEELNEHGDATRQ